MQPEKRLLLGLQDDKVVYENKLPLDNLHCLKPENLKQKQLLKLKRILYN